MSKHDYFGLLFFLSPSYLWVHQRLGFRDFVTIDDLADLFPDLDFVDHKKRKQLLVRPFKGKEKITSNCLFIRIN